MAHLVDPLPDHDTVAILGFGASGRAALRLLRHFKKQVIVSDQQLGEVEPQEGVRFQGGAHDIGDATAVVLSPSLNPEWPENQAKPALQPIFARFADGSLLGLSEVELGLRAFNRPYIAVGGTDGKSTTAALTHALAEAFGYQAVLGGNSWRAFCDVAMDADESVDLAVVEISAFQLHQPHGIRPPVAIATNIASDHLDHYANFDDYVRAKSALFMNQSEGDVAVLNRDDERLRSLGEALRSKGAEVVYFSNQPLQSESGAGEEDELLTVRRGGRTLQFAAERMALPGAHNRRNALAAISALMHVGHRSANIDKLFRILSEFRGLPHRVAFVRELDGVRYYNDSKATNVHAACVGIRAMTGPTIAIVGGVEKGLSLDELWEALAARGRLVVAIGDLRERLAAEAPATLPVLAADSLEDAVQLARSHAKAGDAVLLAPASSSFDMFRSFEERGERFEAAVQALREA